MVERGERYLTMSTKPIIEEMRNKKLPNPYEIKKADIGRLLTLRSGDFGEVIPADVGKRVYLRHGILQMENTEQRDKRKGRGGTKKNPKCTIGYPSDLCRYCKTTTCKDHPNYKPSKKGWRESPDASGKAPIHKKVATRAQAKHAQNTPMKKKEIPKQAQFNPPYRVDVWEERDRLIITVYDANDKEVASWADDDARQMFEDGFFNSTDLEQSVLDYLKDLKIIKGG